MSETVALSVSTAPGGAAGQRGSEFTALLRKVRGRGLLERRRGWYARMIAVNLLVLAAVVTGLVLAGDTWWTLLLAVPLAVWSARTAYVGHDAGHAQIAVGRRANRAIGLLHGNLLLGMSYAWWNDKHNRHHANPNHIEKDPDVGAGALVWTAEQAAVRRGFARWVTRHQAWLFFPMLLLEGIALKVSSVKDLWRQPVGGRAVEGVLLALHAAGYGALLLTCLPVGKAVVFGLLHQALFGLHLGMAFAPNHKGMEMPGPAGERWGHLRRQVLTSRNVRGGPVTDWLLGGLNYQIEHHLFPNMPRCHLGLVQPLVREHCRSLGLPYAETGLLDSYRQGLRHMHAVGGAARPE
ncbi:fatty acid desaturase family protein [Streptomyces violaceusniger]|uniref:Fatty acid desaturase n=1 Tax=Streptomyces violaceusniger (strain Tu 4113) TaxID=653045 RepID=G2PFD2_STRV4|nr:acyl-CoA desaturase [Streptomyces violaceusniger]AEM84195.1 fatty acid desaturase [Streptomyces violaceusniger Tu 4113]AEM84275.1 fatty acid desaturase [Streptomyces violaceusniger Tu 4113]